MGALLLNSTSNSIFLSKFLNFDKIYQVELLIEFNTRAPISIKLVF